jgi:hypothetical protein
MMTDLLSTTSENRPLSYNMMSISYVIDTFHLTFKRAHLFDKVTPVTPSDWLAALLKRSMELMLTSEKARSEFIVAPILLNLRELNRAISIYSGVTFDVEPQQGLKGVCDFILSKTEPFPVVKAPVLMMVEAKKNDIDEGLGQCTAEMVAAQIFNQRQGNPIASVYGCITTGELWQFLKLSGSDLILDETRIYIEHVDLILGTLNAIIESKS